MPAHGAHRPTPCARHAASFPQPAWKWWPPRTCMPRRRWDRAGRPPTSTPSWRCAHPWPRLRYCVSSSASNAVPDGGWGYRGVRGPWTSTFSTSPAGGSGGRRGVGGAARSFCRTRRCTGVPLRSCPSSRRRHTGAIPRWGSLSAPCSPASPWRAVAGCGNPLILLGPRATRRSNEAAPRKDLPFEGDTACTVPNPRGLIAWRV